MAPNDAKSSKCEADADMQRLFSYIDGNRERFIGDLDEAIRIKSVSAWPDNRKVGERLGKLGSGVRTILKYTHYYY